MTETVIYQSDEGSLTMEQLAVMRRGRFAGKNTELLLIEAIEALHADNQRLAAIASGNFENTQLIDTSLAGGEFSISLAQGPVPYLVEYLAQMLGHRHLEKPLNYSAIDLTHREFGPMTLTLQRKTGKSLQTIAGEHLKGLREVRRLIRDAEAAKMFIDDYLATLPLQEGDEAQEPESARAPRDPGRLLKEALFALLEMDAEAQQYGGVLTKGQRKAWLTFELRDDAAPGSVGQDVEQLIAMITPDNYAHQRSVGDVHGWCSRLRAQLLAAIRPEAEKSAAEDGATHEPVQLSTEEQFLLEWLGREEFNQYGECHGTALDSLVRLGLAQLGEVPAKGEHFRTVWLTPAGIAALGQGDGKREIAS